VKIGTGQERFFSMGAIPDEHAEELEVQGQVTVRRYEDLKGKSL